MEKNIGGKVYNMVLLADPDTGWPLQHRVAPTDRSGSINVGGTPQVLLVAATRRGYWFQNLSAGDLWINELGDAAAAPPSLKVPAGGYYENPPSAVPDGTVSVFGATTGQAFSAREW